MQTLNRDAVGYIDEREWEKKAKRKQWHLLKCERCMQLEQGKLVNAVALQCGDDGRSEPGELVQQEDLRQAVTQLRSQHAVVALVVDCTDLNGSLLGRIRAIAGSNPVFVVATKADALPHVQLDKLNVSPAAQASKAKQHKKRPQTPALDVTQLETYIQDELKRKRYSVASVVAVSGKSGAGMARAVSMLLKARKGRDIWVIGAANVGKSTFMKSLLSAMREGGDLRAPTRRLPTTSAMPGTTLNTVRVHSFDDGAELVDTPGVCLHHRIHHLLMPEDVSALRVHAPLRTRSISPPKHVDDAVTAESNTWAFTDDDTDETSDKLTGLQHHSVCMGALVRVDIVQAPANIRLVAVLPPGVDTTLHEHDSECDGLGREIIMSVGGLLAKHRVELHADDIRRNLADICPSGLGGWLTIWAGGSTLDDGKIILDVHVPRGIEVFQRNAIPITNDPHPFFSTMRGKGMEM